LWFHFIPVPLSTKVRNLIAVPVRYGKKSYDFYGSGSATLEGGPSPPLTCTMNVVRDIEREVIVDHVLDLIDIRTFSVFMAIVVEP
jgi:hypothetical protein